MCFCIVCVCVGGGGGGGGGDVSSHTLLYIRISTEQSVSSQLDMHLILTV